MSRWLVIETSLPQAIVAVVDIAPAAAVVREIKLVEPKLHAERLPHAVAEAVGEEAVAGVAVGIGPGSFIGVRTGMAFAKGLCRAWGVPLVGLLTLEAVARSCFDGSDGSVCASIDAKRGERYAQVYDVVEGRFSCRSSAFSCAPDAVPAADVVGEKVTALGLARALAASPRRDERAGVVPLYVRPPDAKLPAIDPARTLARLER